MSKYEYTEDMGEISGFGGGYEDACRRMVIAGVEWMDAHPNAAPQYHSYHRICGIIEEDTVDAELLSKAICAACEDCSGAMHQAAVSHALFIKANGWDAYAAKMRDAHARRKSGN